MKRIKQISIPTLKFNSDYFQCPRCGWKKGPVLVKGDIAHAPCGNCGHSYLVRIK